MEAFFDLLTTVSEDLAKTAICTASIWLFQKIKEKLMNSKKYKVM